MTDTYVYPYRSGSRSAAGLAQALPNTRRISLEKSKFVGRPKHTVINWGATTLPDNVLSAGRILNPPNRVVTASNKLKFFNAVRVAGDNGPRVPAWTTTRSEAANWFQEERVTLVLARTVLAGHSGEGIQMIESADQLLTVPEGTLLVAYQPKRDEFRVHVTRNGIFAVARKARKLDVPEDQVNWRIRNHDGGFIFAQDNVSLPNADSEEQVMKALRVTGLDFGAVDLIYNARKDTAWVLEINTAPGLEGRTVQQYAEAIQGLL